MTINMKGTTDGLRQFTNRGSSCAFLPIAISSSAGAEVQRPSTVVVEVCLLPQS
jgi:Cu/Ag efflux pump CusA